MVQNPALKSFPGTWKNSCWSNHAFLKEISLCFSYHMKKDMHEVKLTRNVTCITFKSVLGPKKSISMSKLSV